jgi:hypothetical protein
MRSSSRSVLQSNESMCLDCGSTLGTRRGLCQRCYNKRKYYALTLPPLKRASAGDAARRHLEASMRGPDECWPWVGHVSADGYGWTAHGPASRFAYGELVGPIPSGHELDHRCHSDDPGCFAGRDCAHRRCVNPTHLEPVDPLVNKLRAHSYWANQTHCINGHEFTEENTYWNRNKRQCKTCQRAGYRRYNQRRRAV